MRETEKEEGEERRKEKWEEGGGGRGEERKRKRKNKKFKHQNNDHTIYFKKMGNRHTLPAGLPPSCRRRLQSPLGSTWLQKKVRKPCTSQLRLWASPKTPIFRAFFFPFQLRKVDWFPLGLFRKSRQIPEDTRRGRSQIFIVVSSTWL